MAITNKPIFNTVVNTENVSAGITAFNSNIDMLVINSTVSAGFGQLASIDEVDIGVDSQKIVSPSTLNIFINSLSSQIINLFMTSATNIDVINRVSNKFIVPDNLDVFISLVSANITEVNAGQINNKFIVPASYIALEDANFNYSSIPDYIYTYNYTGSLQTFVISGSIKYMVIKCIGGGGGGFRDQSYSSVGPVYFYYAESSFVSANNVNIVYAECGNSGSNSGGNGANGTLAGTGGKGPPYASHFYPDGVDGTGFYNGNNIKISDYINIEKCLGGASGDNWTTGVKIYKPGFGGPGSGIAGGGGGGAGTSLVFCTFENNVLFIDKSFVTFNNYDVINNICSKIYISDQTLRIYVGKGALGGGDGDLTDQSITTGNNGQVIIYCWNG